MGELGDEEVQSMEGPLQFSFISRREIKKKIIIIRKDGDNFQAYTLEHYELLLRQFLKATEII